MDFHQLITEPQYLDWDIGSTNVKLNTDKGVWCLLVSRFATRGPPQHSTRCHRNRACYEDNKTATVATTGGVTRKPGSHGSSSKHDTCALKVKNIHRLNARYWTWAQRVLCLWVGCLQSSGWPLQFFYWRAERQIQHGRSLTWHVWCKILADCIHVLLGFRANPPRICGKRSPLNLSTLTRGDISAFLYMPKELHQSQFCKSRGASMSCLQGFGNIIVFL